MRAHQYAICSGSWWAKPMRTHRCSCRKNTPIIDAAQNHWNWQRCSRRRQREERHRCHNWAERQMVSEMIGWSLKRSQLSPIKNLCRFTLRAWLSFVCDAPVVPLNLPVTTSTLLETGTSARGTGSPYTKDLTRNYRNLSSFNSGEMSWICHSLRNGLWSEVHRLI